MPLPRALTRLERQEAVPARDAPFISLNRATAALDRAKVAACEDGAHIVGKSGIIRMQDGRVRLYFDIQLPQEGA